MSTTPSTPPGLPVLPTVGRLLLARLGDFRDGLIFEDQRFSWDDHVRESLDRGAWLVGTRQADVPFHVGVLLDNLPEFSFLLGAAALSGAVLVGLNPTRRGAELDRDLAATDCGLVITEQRYAGLLSGSERVVVVDCPAWADELAPFRGTAPPSSSSSKPADDSERLIMLIFTSGTSGEPKAVRVTDRKVAGPGMGMVRGGAISRDDIAYLSMPMFHSACVMQGWAPALAAGATMVLRRKFSASGFRDDVRRFGVTYFHYVGKPLTYILATPERPDDSDNALRIACGNEAAPLDIDRFARRFGCKVEDGFGSTEGGVYLSRTRDTPQGSLGRAGDGVDILDSVTGAPVLTALFDNAGKLLNAESAIGELVNTTGPGQFAGYYRNEAAEQERMRDGMYWTGDLAYRDAQGFVYFAGRTIDWLRVDGENLGAAPIERILARYGPVSQVAVYAVPDARVGDQVMAALRLHDAQDFDPADFSAFLTGQADLGTKWVPRYVRVAAALPMTETNKILKRLLAAEAWTCHDPVWIRDGRGRSHALSYRLMTAE